MGREQDIEDCVPTSATAQTLSGTPSAPVPQSWSATMSSGNNNRIANTSQSASAWTYDATVVTIALRLSIRG